MMAHRIVQDELGNRSVYDYHQSLDLESIMAAIKEAGDGIPDFEFDKLEIQPTSVCQLKCLWCFGKYLSSGRREEMPISIFKRNVIAPLKKEGMNPVIMVSGLFGDPLLHSQAEDLFKALKGFRFGLYTNGLALTDSLSRIISKSAGIRYNRPSFMTLDVSALLNAGRLGEVLPKIKCLLSMRNPERLLVNATILMQDYLDSNPWLAQDLSSAGFDAIRFNTPLTPIQPRQQRWLDYAHQAKDKYGQKVYVEAKPFSKCYAMANSLSIAADGGVYPCSQTCADAFSSLKLGSIKDEKITGIWHGLSHRQLYKTFDPAKSMCRCNAGDLEFNLLVQRSLK